MLQFQYFGPLAAVAGTVLQLPAIAALGAPSFEIPSCRRADGSVDYDCCAAKGDQQCAHGYLLVETAITCGSEMVGGRTRELRKFRCDPDTKTYCGSGEWLVKGITRGYADAVAYIPPPTDGGTEPTLLFLSLSSLLVALLAGLFINYLLSMSRFSCLAAWRGSFATTF